MKKAFIALAVAAGAIASAHADTTTLYGQIGADLNFNFGNVSNDNVKIGDSLKAGIEEAGLTKTKIGVKGTENLGSGVAALFNYEFGVNTAAGISDTKKAYLGFKGGFGQVTLGKQGNVYGDFTGKANFFNKDDVFGGWADLGMKQTGSTLRYNAPEFVEGVQASVGYGLKKKLAEVGVGYSANGIDAGVALQYQFDQPKDTNPYRVGLGVAYETDMFKVGLDYQFKPETMKDSKDSYHALGLGAGYNVTADSTLYAGAQFNAADFKAGQSYGLGYEYNVSKRTKAFVDAGLFHKGESSKNAKDGINNFQMAVGVRHKF